MAPGSWFERRKSSNKAWVSTIPWGDIDLVKKSFNKINNIPCANRYPTPTTCAPALSVSQMAFHVMKPVVLIQSPVPSSGVIER